VSAPIPGDPEYSLTLDDYQREAMASSVYPRLGCPDTHARVRAALPEFPGQDIDVLVADVVDALVCAVLGSVPTEFAPSSLPIYPAMALCGEAGEFAEKIKKAWRDGTPLDRPGAAKELGDVLWYVGAAARDLGYTLEEVAQMNLDKIRSRRARGTLAGSGDNR